MVEICDNCKKQKSKCDCVKKAEASHNDLKKHITNFNLLK